MKRMLFALLLTIAGLAAAAELDDANKLLMAKEYDRALPIYTRLANAGNAEAQFRLGEMYWFGDGTAMDLAKAAAWFEKSAAGGIPAARESLAILKRRESRGGEITYWTSTYAGEDLISGRFDCKVPVLPAVSTTNDEIVAVRKAVADWQACYDGFAKNFNDAMPAGKRIPADVVDMMNQREAEQARKHMGAVYSKVGADVKARAASFVAQRDAWQRATETWVAQQNARQEMLRVGLELDRRAAEAPLRKRLEAPPKPVIRPGSR